jgi:hypothetical protein
MLNILAITLNTSLIFSGQAVDIGSSEIALSRCRSCQESNGLTSNRAVLYPAKILFAVGGSAVAKEIEKSGHKKTARIFSIVMFLVPSYLAYKNMRIK